MDVERLKIDRSAGEQRPRRRKGRWVGPLVTLGLVGLLLWLFQAQILGFVDAWRLPEVRTQRVLLRSGAAAATASGTSANGYIVARTRAALSADTPGRIVEMNVEEGSVVKQGQIVARLYADEYRAALQHADADLALARTTLERVKLEVGSAEKEVAHSKSAEKAAQADLDQANSNLALAETQFKRAQDLGFTLDEVEELLRLRSDKRRDRVRIRGVATRRVQQIDQKIAELQAMKQALAAETAMVLDVREADEFRYEAVPKSLLSRLCSAQVSCLIPISCD